MPFTQPGQAQTCGSATCMEKGSSLQGITLFIVSELRQYSRVMSSTESHVSYPLGPSSALNQPAPSQRRPGQPVSLNEQAQMRVAALRGRIQGRQNRTGVEFGTGNTTESLLHHEHGGGEPGEAKLIVGWQVRIIVILVFSFNTNHYSRPEATTTAKLMPTSAVKLRNMPCRASCQVWLRID